MSGRRRPSARSGGRSRRGLLLALGGVVASLGAVGRASDAFTTAAADRSAGIGVADDANGVFELDRVDAVRKNRQERLVTVTNTLAESVTLTVSTAAPRTDLIAPDGSRGSTIEFDLGSGASADVEIESRANGTIDYTIEAAADALDFSAVRSVEVRPGNGGGNPGQGGGGPPGG